MNDGQAGRGALVWKSTQGDSPGKNTLPDRGRGVLQLPPGLGGVEVAAPQLPVKALGRQWVLFYLKVVVFDVVKGWGDDPFPVLLNAGEYRFSPRQGGGGGILASSLAPSPAEGGRDSWLSPPGRAALPPTPILLGYTRQDSSFSVNQAERTDS